jgi:hypothetical protein
MIKIKDNNSGNFKNDFHLKIDLHSDFLMTRLGMIVKSESLILLIFLTIKFRRWK